MLQVTIIYLKQFVAKQVNDTVGILDTREQLSAAIAEKKTARKRYGALNIRLAELNEDDEDDSIAEVNREINQLRTDIENRNSQISELKQKLNAYENKKALRWDDIDSLAKAKDYRNYVFVYSTLHVLLKITESCMKI